MQYQVTEIDFDFDKSCPYCGGDCYNDHDNACDGFSGDFDELVQQQEQTANQTIGTIWEADNEDDLIEEITCATGWCIKSINYRHVLS
jgi:hypothetical protein